MYVGTIYMTTITLRLMGKRNKNKRDKTNMKIVNLKQPYKIPIVQTCQLKDKDCQIGFFLKTLLHVIYENLFKCNYIVGLKLNDGKI